MMYAELLKATKVKPKPNESPEAFTWRLLRRVIKLRDSEWDMLPEAAQVWVNAQIERDNNRQPIEALQI
jgi:hypothetical protein